MIKRHYIGYDFGILYNVLSQSEFLTEAGAVVTYNSSIATIYIKDTDENTLFRITKVNSSSTNISWTSYASSNLYADGYAGNGSYPASLDYVYTCKNGIIITINGRAGSGGIGNGILPIRIVKTNLGKLAFISKRNNVSTTSNAYRENIDCIAWGDVAPLNTAWISNRYDTHYEVVPMLTNSDADVVSYTDKSGSLLYSTGDLAFKIINISGKKYLSDSYFAIEDE